MDNQDICLICLDPVNDKYAKIDNISETINKYHIECIDKWLNKSGRGLFTNDQIESYNIYDSNNILETIIVLKNLNNFDNGDNHIDGSEVTNYENNLMYDNSRRLYSTQCYHAIINIIIVISCSITIIVIFFNIKK